MRYEVMKYYTHVKEQKRIKNVKNKCLAHECLIYTFNRSIQKQNTITFSISTHLLLFYICPMCSITEVTIMKEIHIISLRKNCL